MTIGRIPSVEGGIQPTIVDAKGDLIAATAADTVNRLAVGSNDQVLVADSAASTGLAWKSYGSQMSASNPVLNSDYSVWQRGTSISLAASTGAYTADRWFTQTQANQASTVSRQTTGDTTNLPNIQYCARVQRNSGQTGTGNLLFSQSLETVNAIPFAGKTVTMSFYARKGADFAGTLSAYLIAGTGTDQNRGPGTSYTGETFPVNGVTVSLTTTWQRFTFTGTIGATVTEFATYLNWACSGTAGTNDYYEITGVQIDVGSVAQPFRRAMNTIQGELAACQRYFQVLATGNSKPLNVGFYNGASRVDTVIPFKVTMRTTPTASVASGTNYYQIERDGVADTFNDLTLGAVSTDFGQFYVLSNVSGTTGWAGAIYTNNASASITVSAEL